MIDFPSNPNVGQIFNSGSGPIYIWDGVAWSLTSAFQLVAWEPIAVTDFTAQTQVIQTDLGAYRELRITLELEGGANTTTVMQVSANNGASWQSGASDYTTSGPVAGGGSVTQPTISGSSWGWFMNNNLGSGRAASGSMVFGQFNKSKETQGVGTQSWITVGGTFSIGTLSMNCALATAWNALKFAFSVASSGRIIIEGIKG